MSAFETVNRLLYKRNLEFSYEMLEDFSPYLTCKALSFYGDDMVNYVNDTLNSYQHVFTTEEDRFKFFDNVIPKLKWKKSNYVKKPKKDKVIDNTIPIPEFYSKREMEMFLTLDIE